LASFLVNGPRSRESYQVISGPLTDSAIIADSGLAAIVEARRCIGFTAIRPKFSFKPVIYIISCRIRQTIYSRAEIAATANWHTANWHRATAVRIQRPRHCS